MNANSPHCPAVSTDSRDSSGIATLIQIESSRLIPWLLLSTLLSGVAVASALCVAWTQATAYRELEREVRLQRLETDELGAALARAGIPTHREGDAP